MDDDLKKMLDESKKCSTTVDTSVVNMDFSSFYGNQMKWWNITPVPKKVIIRKTRIKRIFQ